MARLSAADRLELQWIERGADVLLHFLWQGTLIAILLWGLLQLLSHRHASGRELAGIVALLSCLICPLVTWSLLSERVTPVEPALSTTDHCNSAAAVADGSAPSAEFAKEDEPTSKSLGNAVAVGTAPPTASLGCENPVAQESASQSGEMRDSPRSTDETFPDSGQGPTLPIMTPLDSDGRIPPVVLREAAPTLVADGGESTSRVPALTSWRWSIIMAWFCGVVLCTSRLLTGGVGLWALSRKSHAAPAAIEKLVTDLTRQLQLRKAPSVRMTRFLQQACVTGLIRPLVLIPASWASEIPVSVLESILVHELIHVRRHDLWLIHLQRVVETLLFYHPAVWWISRQVTRQRELCCDAAAVSLIESTRYATALEYVARHETRSVARPLLASIGGTRMDLLERIQIILERDVPKPHRYRGSLAGAIALLLLIGGFLTVPIPSADSALGEETADAAVTKQTTETENDETNKTAETAESGTTESGPGTAGAWTDLLTAVLDHPRRHHGIVYGSQGEPLEGAKVFAVRADDMFERKAWEAAKPTELGAIRAITDEQGRFEFDAPDLIWNTVAGEVNRHETVLVATHEGLIPGVARIRGGRPGVPSRRSSRFAKPAAIHLAPPAQLHGRFLLEGNPVADAAVRITEYMVPIHHDLDRHIAYVESLGPTSNGGDYAERFARPSRIPWLTTEVRTDASGRFRFDNLPRDHIVRIEVTHPQVRTTSLEVAVREMDLVFMKGDHGLKTEPIPALHGSGFSFDLPPGVTIRGQVMRHGAGFESPVPVAGARIGLANQHDHRGFWGREFPTDEQGRFELSGLEPDYNEPGYDVVVVGSFSNPITAGRFTVQPGTENELKVNGAVPYRLRLTDEEGNPLHREVFSIFVQVHPHSRKNYPASRFHVAEEVAPGIYEGVVPVGPGAVLVQRGDERDRPILVDPKRFFEPGRSDWTLEERRYAYGDEWQIIQPEVIAGNHIAAYPNSQHSQLTLAAAVFTQGRLGREALSLEARIMQDEPTPIRLVDADGNPVSGVELTRQNPYLNVNTAPSKVFLSGLHPERAEFIRFFQKERNLIGFLRATAREEPYRVVMLPAARLTGRIVTPNGEPSYDFSIAFEGAVPPETATGNFVRDFDSAPRGRFTLVVPPGEEYSGRFHRKHTNWQTRPSLGHAFGPVTPEPGETLDLGDIVLPSSLAVMDGAPAGRSQATSDAKVVPDQPVVMVYSVGGIVDADSPVDAETRRKAGASLAKLITRFVPARPIDDDGSILYDDERRALIIRAEPADHDRVGEFLRGLTDIVEVTTIEIEKEETRPTAGTEHATRSEATPASSKASPGRENGASTVPMAGTTENAGPKSPNRTASQLEEALNAQTDLELESVALIDAIEQLSDRHRINIVCDEVAAKEAEIDLRVPVNVHLSGVALRSVLRLMLEPFGLIAIPDEEILLITTKRRHAAEMVIETYDLSGLIERWQANSRRPAQETKGEPSGPVLYPDGTDEFDLNKQLASLVTAIESLTGHHKWLSSNQGEGSISSLLHPPRLVVRHNREVQEEVSRILRQLDVEQTRQVFWVRPQTVLEREFPARIQRIDGHDGELISISPLSPNRIRLSFLKPGKTGLTVEFADDSSLRFEYVISEEADNVSGFSSPRAFIDHRLDRRISVDLRDAELKDVLTSIAEQLGINLVVDGLVLRQTSASDDSRVRLKLDDLPARRVLELILHPRGLTCDIQDEVLSVTTQERVSQEYRIQMYDLNSQAPDSALQVESYVRLLMSIVDPHSWSVRGGEAVVATIDAEPGTLLIRQTRKNHAAIAAVLADLRKQSQGTLPGAKNGVEPTPVSESVPAPDLNPSPSKPVP